jgi:hypothetical protein
MKSGAALDRIGARSIFLNESFSRRTLMSSERQRKHGLTSSTLVVLPDEDRNEYNELLCGFRDSFEPANEFEDALVVRLAQAHWRGLRSRAIETGMLDTSANLQRREARRIVENCRENLNAHEAIGVGFMIMPAERWQMYLRYDATISREFFKTLDTLAKLQRARQRQTSAAKQAIPEPPPPPPEERNCPIPGFAPFRRAARMAILKRNRHLPVAPAFLPVWRFSREVLSYSRSGSTTISELPPQ